VFCQNYDTSHGHEGRKLAAAELAHLFLRLQAAGCHNINLVTPSHVVPQILEALPIAIEEGFSLPLVYNTSGYDSRETLRLLDGVVDIYMPDFKLWTAEVAARYLLAEDYPAVAREAIVAMHRQVGDLMVDEDGLALRGLLVRHLVLPGMLADTRAIVHYLVQEISPHAYLNLMDQYHPAGQVPGDARFSAVDRYLNRAEFTQALKLARKAGLWRLDPWPILGDK
jgi:putative pyruvate formate lyase activating enzyme